MTKGSKTIGLGARHTIRLLGNNGRSSPVSPESVYNLTFGDNPGWIVLRVTDGTVVVIAPDGTGLEVR